MISFTALFVDETISEPKAVASMPGVSRIPLSYVGDKVREVAALGIPGVILFGIPAEKDAIGSGAWDAKGVVQEAIREAKKASPETIVIADACFCEYTDHGHCGVLHGEEVHNDETLANLRKEAVFVCSGRGRYRCPVRHDGRHDCCDSSGP